MKETDAIRGGILRLAAEGRVTVRGGEAWTLSTLSEAAPVAPPPTKYRNRRSGGFASVKEERRFGELALLEMAGKITALECQIPFELEVNGILICKYISDFTYVENGRRVVEDVKSPVTAKNPVYRLKKRLMKACLGIDIRES